MSLKNPKNSKMAQNIQSQFLQFYHDFSKNGQPNFVVLKKEKLVMNLKKSALKLLSNNALQEDKNLEL